MKKRKTGVSLF